jgi:hypothetical protein
MKLTQINVILAALIMLIMLSPQVFAAEKSSNENLDKLNLTISLKTIERNMSGEIKNLEILCRFKNQTQNDVDFYLEDCGICFWRFSIDGKDFTPLTPAVHCAPCVYRNKVTLKPGETKDYVIKNIPEYAVAGKPKTIKIGYLLSWKPLAYVYSNELELK